MPKKLRYTYILYKILNIYKDLNSITFPLRLNSVLKLFPECRQLSYQRFSEINHCSVEEVISLCESGSGCTHFDVATGRYLILYNDSTGDNNNRERQRWTFSHELGHIALNHHAITTRQQLAEHGMFFSTSPQCESEANFFAANLLAPFPLFEILGVHSVEDVQRVFWLSKEAATIRFSEYIQWKRSHVKQSWESDLVKEFKKKSEVKKS